jgi:steroid delta-isomerase-like uncharacterized protein
MTGEEVKKLLDGYALALNDRDIDRLMSYFTDDCTRSDALTGSLHGKEAVKGYYVTLMSAFPDLQFSIDTVLAVDDSAAVEWTFTGTHQGAFPPLESYAATGKKVTLFGATFFDFKDGKIASERVHADYGALIEELGLVPQIRKAA